MRNLLRTVLLLLLSVALPLYAGAAARAAIPCPMHASVAAMDADSAQDSKAADCCEEADTDAGAAGGTACKAGADCQPVSVPLLGAAPGGRLPVADTTVAPPPHRPRASATAADIGRPPAFLAR